MNRADVGMIQGRGGTGFAAEAFERIRIVSDIGRNELDRNKASELCVFRFVDHTHATAAEFFDDAVMRDGLADHGQRGAIMLGVLNGQVKLFSGKASSNG